jgi:ferritin-like metal-binding protein YciE
MKDDLKFESIFLEILADLYDAEKQIIEALPKLIAEADSELLAGALQLHLDETKEQVVRLETIFERMGEQPGSGRSEAMLGLISEGEKSLGKFRKSPALDIALIASAQKVEHYELAAYGSACRLAEMLGQEDALELLQDTLEEERTADENLAEVAEGILTGDDAAAEDSGEEE